MKDAMKTLLDFRQHIAQSLAQSPPKPVAKKGFLQWLRSRT